MRRLVFLATLSLVSMLVLAPTAMAQNTLNCGDFPSQAAAQQNLIQNPDDPNRLDENNNSVACETYPYPAGTPQDLNPVTQGTGAPGYQYAQTPTASQGSGQQMMQSGTNTALPSTGGPSLLLPAAGLLLVGTGLVAMILVRRAR